MVTWRVFAVKTYCSNGPGRPGFHQSGERIRPRMRFDAPSRRTFRTFATRRRKSHARRVCSPLFCPFCSFCQNICVLSASLAEALAKAGIHLWLEPLFYGLPRVTRHFNYTRHPSCRHSRCTLWVPQLYPLPAIASLLKPNNFRARNAPYFLHSPMHITTINYCSKASYTCSKLKARRSQMMKKCIKILSKICAFCAQRHFHLNTAITSISPTMLLFSSGSSSAGIQSSCWMASPTVWTGYFKMKSLRT